MKRAVASVAIPVVAASIVHAAAYAVLNRPATKAIGARKIAAARLRRIASGGGDGRAETGAGRCGIGGAPAGLAGAVGAAAVASFAAPGRTAASISCTDSFGPSAAVSAAAILCGASGFFLGAGFSAATPAVVGTGPLPAEARAAARISAVDPGFLPAAGFGAGAALGVASVAGVAATPPCACVAWARAAARISAVDPGFFAGGFAEGFSAAGVADAAGVDSDETSAGGCGAASAAAGAGAPPAFAACARAAARMSLVLNLGAPGLGCSDTFVPPDTRDCGRTFA